MRLDAYFRAHRDRHLAEYFDFIRIPSISAIGAHCDDVRRAAVWVAERCGRIGLEHVEIMETGGHPVVYADWLSAPGRPTVLVYGHFDVQPADPIDQWESPPFQPAVRGECVFARGAADDKVMVIPLFAAEALLGVEGRLPVNLKCFFEGQEEILSPEIPEFLARHRERFACDIVVSADGAQWGPDQPSLTLGHRGLVGVEINVRGAARDLAAGGHGGGVGNPIHALAAILASMHGRDGRVLVEGFYDRVTPPDAAIRRVLAAVPFDEAGYLRGVGVETAHGEAGWTMLERRWLRPTLEVNGIWGGYQGEGNKSVLPAEAGAKITCRLVPEQDPEEIAGLLERHVAAQVPQGVRVFVTRMLGRGRPYRLDPGHPAVAVAASALNDAFGKEPMYVFSGGTLPVADLFLTHLGAHTISLAFSAPDERAHAPNEFYRLRNFDRGLRVYAAFLRGFGGQARQP